MHGCSKLLRFIHPRSWEHANLVISLIPISLHLHIFPTTKTPSLHYLPYPRHISPLHILIGLQLQNLFLSLDFHIVLTTITQGIILSILENHRNRFMERASKAVLEWRRRRSASAITGTPSNHWSPIPITPYNSSSVHFILFLSIRDPTYSHCYLIILHHHLHISVSLITFSYPFSLSKPSHTH